MKARISCAVCEGTDKAVSGEVAAPTLTELGPLLTAIVVAWHATPPHCPHQLKIEFSEELRPDVDLVIRCVGAQCHSPQFREFKTKCPRELVGALTLLFHTSHEGHPIEIVYDGRSWRSPG